MEIWKNKPVDKERFSKEVALVNTKRTFWGIIVMMILSVVMLRSQYIVYSQNYDPMQKERSLALIQYASVWLGISVILLIIYMIFKKLSVADRVKNQFTHVLYFSYIMWGFSINAMLMALDGQSISSYIVAMALFATILFLIHPVANLITMFVIIMGMEVIEIFSLMQSGPFQLIYSRWSDLLDSIVLVTILTFTVSIVMYNHFVQDFNKNYEIEKLNKINALNAQIDSLTEVWNRRAFIDKLSKQKETLANDKAWLFVGIVDIDYFKQYNDSYGHLKGDQCLKDVAKTLQKTLTLEVEESIFARYGGEEFIFSIPSQNLEDTKKIVQKMIDAVAILRIKHEQSKVSDVLTLSGGVCGLVVKEEIHLEEAVNYADELLYIAKGNGRNQVKYDIFSQKSKG